MRNKIGCLALLLFVSAVSFGQIHFAIGPKLGLNFGTLSYDPDVTTKSGRTAMMFGAAVELMFSKMFGVQIEPGYAMKGNSFDNLNLQNGATSATRAVNEIQFPILFKAKFLDGPVKLYSFLGPNLGIVASSVIKYSGGQNATIPDQDEAQTTSGIDFGMDFGSGLEYMIGKKIGITFDTRYSLGFSNLYSPQGHVQGAIQSRKSRGFQIQFGALFEM